MRRQGPVIGDVFAIPIDEFRIGYGQIVCDLGYIVVFRPAFERSARQILPDIVGSEIALFGQTIDTRIEDGDWAIVGSSPPDLQRIPRPHYLSYRLGKDVIMDFDDEYLREATVEDRRFYEPRWSVDPLYFEMALQALHGVGPWDAEYDRLTIAHAELQAGDLPK